MSGSLSTPYSKFTVLLLVIEYPLYDTVIVGNVLSTMVYVRVLFVAFPEDSIAVYELLLLDVYTDVLNLCPLLGEISKAAPFSVKIAFGNT